jgi:ELWxxDGT repeat protein
MKNYCFAVFCILLAANAFAQKASLVKDIYTGDENAELYFFKQVDSNAYFTITAQTDFLENATTLWKIEHGTHQLTAIHNQVNEIQVVDKKIYFFCNLAKKGNPSQIFLYQYNTSNSKLDSMFYSGNATNVFVFNKQLCYFAFGNFMQIDFPNQQDITIKKLGKTIERNNYLVTDSTLYFFTESRELWKSNGTESGTIPLRQFKLNTNVNSGYQFDKLFPWKGNFYFVGYESSTGQELWKTDGTVAGTVIVKDIIKGTGGAIFSNFMATDNYLFYMVKDNYNNTLLYRTDGTALETKQCYLGLNKNAYFNPIATLSKYIIFEDYDADYQSIVLGTDGNTVENLRKPTVGNRRTENFLTVKDTAYFAFTQNDKVVEMWQSNGTKSGTKAIISPIKYLAHDTKSKGVLLQGVRYFTASDDEYNYEMWRSDGTPKGTFQVTDILKGKAGANPYNYYLWGNEIVFMANNGVAGIEPWISNITTGKAQIIKNFNTNNFTLERDKFYPFIKINGKFCFFATDIAHGTELWASDGSTEGTNILKNFTSYNLSTRFDDYKNNVFDNKLYLNLKTDLLNYALWETDATEVGTKMILLDTLKNFFRQPLFKKDGFLYYYAYDTDTSPKENQTISKIKLGEINPTPIVVMTMTNKESFLFNAIVKNEKIVLTSLDNQVKINIFDQNDGITSIKLGQIQVNKVFMSDDNLTIFYYDYINKLNEFYCYNLTTKKSFTLEGFRIFQTLQYDNRILFFGKDNSSAQTGIYEIDFENKNVTKISFLGTNLFKSYLGFVKNKLIYTSAVGLNLVEQLVTFDLATLKEETIGLNLPGSVSVSESIAQTKNFLYFYLENDTEGLQIYQTGGSKETTKAITNITKDIYAYYSAAKLIELNGLLYFIAYDKLHGYELWKYDFKPTDVSEPNQEENSVQLFPNPSSTDVQIKAAEQWQSVSIFDALGKEYYHNNLTTNELRIPTSNLPNGIYLMEIIFSNQKRTCKKFVVQK